MSTGTPSITCWQLAASGCSHTSFPLKPRLLWPRAMETDPGRVLKPRFPIFSVRACLGNAQRGPVEPSGCQGTRSSMRSKLFSLTRGVALENLDLKHPNHHLVIVQISAATPCGWCLFLCWLITTARGGRYTNNDVISNRTACRLPSFHRGCSPSLKHVGMLKPNLLWPRSDVKKHVPPRILETVT